MWQGQNSIEIGANKYFWFDSAFFLCISSRTRYVASFSKNIWNFEMNPKQFVVLMIGSRVQNYLSYGKCFIEYSHPFVGVLWQQGKKARKPGKKLKENPLVCTGEDKRWKWNTRRVQRRFLIRNSNSHRKNCEEK